MKFGDTTTSQLIRDIFRIFIQNCENAYPTFEYLTLGQELVAFRGRNGFRQSKPAKYRIKISALVDLKLFYTMNLAIYCGKHPDNSYFAVNNKPFDPIDRMVNCVSSSRNITMDNLCTSFESSLQQLGL